MQNISGWLIADKRKFDTIMHVEGWRTSSSNVPYVK